MNLILEHLARVLAIGVLATAVMDAWLVLLKALAVPTLNFGLIGRWIGHWPRGVFAHAAIAQAPPVRNELALGWSFHYLSGIAFAALLVALEDAGGTGEPSLFLPMAVGVATVAVPWFVMQPAMGAGVASSRTASPGWNRARSLANHTVFGFGLYAATLLLAWVSR